MLKISAKFEVITNEGAKCRWIGKMGGVLRDVTERYETVTENIN